MPCENRTLNIFESSQRPPLIQHVRWDVRIHDTRDILDQSRALLAHHCSPEPMPLCLRQVSGADDS